LGSCALSTRGCRLWRTRAKARPPWTATSSTFFVCLCVFGEGMNFAHSFVHFDAKTSQPTPHPQITPNQLQTSARSSNAACHARSRR
jgi:hypothetical protein